MNTYKNYSLVPRHSLMVKDELRNKASTNPTVDTSSHVHVSAAESGIHMPLDAQVAIILVDGTNIELHLKNISAPSVVF